MIPILRSGLAPVCLAVALGATAGCGSDAAALPPADLAPASPVDQTAPADLAATGDLLIALGIGMECPLGTECSAGLVCLGSRLSAGLPSRGYCSKQCVNDPDCGAFAFCGPPLVGFGGNYCWLRCDAGGHCKNPDHVCGRRLDGVVDLVNQACLLGNSSAREGAPCATFGDCNRNQTCANNPFEAANGFCATVGCTPGDDSTCVAGNDAHCLPIPDSPLAACFPGCQKKNGNADCRASENYTCTDVVINGNTSSVCTFSHASVGAPCQSDSQCGPGNSPWKCLVSVNLPDNYCTGVSCDPAVASTCPNHSHCVVVQGQGSFCGADCTSDNDCLLVRLPRSPYFCKPFDQTRPDLKVCLP